MAFMTLSVIVPASPEDARGRLLDALASLDTSVAAAPDDLRAAVEVEKVVVVDADRRGVSWARNEGLRRATGDYIGWVDADDAVTAEWFGTIARVIVESAPDVDIVTFDSVREENGIAKLHGYGRPAGDVPPRLFLEDVLREVRTGGYLWRNVFKRKLFDGLAFDDAVAGMEDFMLLPELVYRAEKVVYVPKSVYRYVIRDTSLSNSNGVFKVAWRRADTIRGRIDRWRKVDAALGRAAVLGEASVSYGRLVESMLHVELPRGGMGDAKYLRRHLPEIAFSRELDFNTKLDCSLAAFGLIWIPVV